MAIDVEQVVPGAWRIPVPLAGHSDGHVNVYALEGDAGLLLVDTGWSSEWAALDARLREIDHSLDEVVGVVVSHFHVDHCGLSALLQERSGAWVGMHHTEASLLDSRYFHRASYEEAWIAWVQAVGAPDALAAPALRQVDDLAGRVHEFLPDVVLGDGQELTHGPWTLTVLLTPGHTPGHLCFYERRTGMLFTR